MIEDTGIARTRRTLSAGARVLLALNLDGPLLVALGFQQGPRRLTLSA